MLFLSIIYVLLNQAHALPIHGEDTRQEFYEIQDLKTQTLMEASVALFRRATFVPYTAPQGSLEVSGFSLQKLHNLCSTERFLEQPTGAYCSGVLVAPDLVLTAAHCMETIQDCEQTLFVFDYSKKDALDSARYVKTNQMVGCKELVARQYVRRGIGRGWSQGPDSYRRDWALFRLSRPIFDRSPVPISKERANAVSVKKRPLTVIGYPSGLPMKIDNDAKIKRIHSEASLYITADTFHKNSGSPVFDTQTGTLVGLLIEGEEDYEETQSSCSVAVKCYGLKCGSEVIVRTQIFSDRIQGPIRESMKLKP